MLRARRRLLRADPAVVRVRFAGADGVAARSLRGQRQHRRRRRLANTPRHGTTLGTRYRHASGFFANADLVTRAEQLDSNNQPEARRAFHVVNGSVGCAWREWTVTLWARNLFNQRYEKRVFFFGNEDPDYIETRYESRADPRQMV